MVRLAGAGLAIVTLVPIAGCEPDFDVDGAFFPAWIVCMAGGAVLAIAAHGLFVRTGIDGELGPPALVYPSLYILLTLLIWIVCFRT